MVKTPLAFEAVLRQVDSPLFSLCGAMGPSVGASFVSGEMGPSFFSVLVPTAAVGSSATQNVACF
jgi:hypothetical protein